MKKRSLSIFVGLFCLVMALCAVPAVTASAEEGKKGARIEYGLKKGIQQKRSYDEYFRVVVPAGAIVTYREGKNMVAVESEGSNNKGEEYYYFKLPKKGDREITVKYSDGSEAKLKATVESSRKGVTKTVGAKQAKYEPNAEGYEYGRITVAIDGVPSNGREIYVYSGASVENFYYGYNRKYVYSRYYSSRYDDGYNYFSGSYDVRIYSDFHAYVPDSSMGEYYKNSFDEYYHPVSLVLEKDKEEDRARMEAFIKPLIREGNTVIIEPYGVPDEYDPGIYGKTCTRKDSYYNISSISDTELRVNLVTDTYKYKVAKVKIPKQKNPPKVKVDAVKGTISLNNNMEYRFRKYDESGALGAWDGWTKGTSGMKLMSVSNGAIASGGIIEVRLSKTDKALYSKSLSISVPSQPKIDTSQIKWEGVTTNGSIIIKDWNKDTKPYEYTLSAPSDSTKWVTVKKGTITFTKKKPATGTIYIREKATNENAKKGTELKLPSTIASATVSGSSIPDGNITAYSAK